MRLFKILETTFDNFDNTVRTYLSKTFENLGLNYTSNQIFGVIYDGIKGVMQNVMFYIEDGLTEQNIFTASRKRSFYSLAKLSGYEPYYGSAATGTVVISPVAMNSIPGEQMPKVFIKNHSAIMNYSTGVSYTIILPSDEYVIDTSKALMKHHLKIVQGVWTSARFTAKGDKLETFQVANASLYDKQYVKVKVNGVEYKQAPCLYDMTEDELGYVMSCGFDGVFEISFGNGSNGKMLSEGDNVIVEFLTHDGASGNIINPGEQVMKMVSNVYSSNGSTIVPEAYFTMTINDPVTGGTDADTIDLVKSMIGYNSRSLVLASEDNFKQFLKRFSFIGQTTIYTDQSSMKVTASCLENVKLANAEEYLELDPSKLLLTDEQKEMVKTTINNSGKAFAGIKFEMTDPVIRKFAAICYVKLEEESAREVAKTNIRNAIGTYFMNLPESTTFIPKSDLVKTALASDSNIKSFDIDIISDTAEQAWKNGYWIKYVRRMVNGSYEYVPVKVIYEKETTPCMDAFGNISLDSTRELPLLCGGFLYWADKTKKTSDSIRLNALDVMFI